MTTDAAALVLLVGPPGSGKSTWAARRFPVHDLFSLDMFRRILTGDVADQSATREAVRMLDLVVAFRMASGLTTVVDACNTRPEHRERMIAEAREYGVPVLAVVMATPLEVCLTRNAAREVVGAEAAAAPYPGANAAPVPPDIVAKLALEAAETPPRLGEVDAVLTVGADGAAVEWDGADRLPIEVLAAPWLAGTLDAPDRPRWVELR
ncbi:AAA family ATPase [Micromonospora sp. NPDC049366]|uniref:AAA family ATPase n=1 Tax=Micromonospora sp. NPDC049366 TaxID=3364271 RepID=UPI00378954E9